MCLVLSWKTIFLPICITIWLSHFKGIRTTEGIESSCGNQVSHASSEQTHLINLYAISAKDKSTMLCFFDFYEIGECPNNIQKPAECHVCGHAT